MTRRCVITGALVGALGWSTPAHAFCNDVDLTALNALLAVLDYGLGLDELTEFVGVDDHYDLECEDAGHGVATGNLSFLRSEVTAGIGNANFFQDMPWWAGGHQDTEAAHFDSCRFPESADRIRSKYDDAVAALDPLAPDVPSAIDSFGALLHPIQDFYAHSNYVELLEETYGAWGYVDPAFLVDGGTGPFRELVPLSWVRDDILVAAVPDYGMPAEFQPSLADGSAIPRIEVDGLGSFRGLLTGWNEGSRCFDLRPDARLQHGGSTELPTGVELNKDRAKRPGYAEAITLAGWQTQQEWCRLLHLTRDTGGLESASILMTLWADPAEPPHPAATSCAPATPGLVEVTVGVRTDVRQSSDEMGSDLVLALYTDDFQQSAASQASTDGPWGFGPPIRKG